MKKINLAIFLLAVLFVSACTSPVQTPDNNLPGADQNAQGNNPTVTTTTPGQSGDSTLNEFMSYEAKSQALREYSVSYDIQGSDETASMQQSMYRKDTKLRLDSVIGSMRTFTLIEGKTTTTCTQLQAPNWDCTQYNQTDEKINTTSTTDSDTQYNEIRNETESDDYTFSKDGTMQVAGVTANCWKSVSAKTNDTSRLCLSNEGIMLYTKSQSGNSTTEMKATAYSLSVPDSSFNLPEGASIQSQDNAISGAGLSCADCEYMPENLKAGCLKGCV